MGADAESRPEPEQQGSGVPDQADAGGQLELLGKVHQGGHPVSDEVDGGSGGSGPRAGGNVQAADPDQGVYDKHAHQLALGQQAHSSLEGQAFSPDDIALSRDMYLLQGDWGSAANERLQMKMTAGVRSAGVSSVTLNGEFHEFSVMETTHPKSDKIYLTLDGLNQHVRKVWNVLSFIT